MEILRIGKKKRFKDIENGSKYVEQNKYVLSNNVMPASVVK